METKKRVLISGISGSIGCHFFAHFCHNTDWDIVGIDSFRHKGWSERITHMFIEHPGWRDRLMMFTHDIATPFSSLLQKRIGKIDYIINLASMSDVYDSIQNPVPFVQNNVNVVLNMLEYARGTKPEVFIQISTDEVYGPTDGKTGLKEWSPILPSNPYAASKACQEALAISYWRAYNVPVIITNTMNNFGEMQQGSKFPVMVQKKIENGEQIVIHGKEGDTGSRSYIHSRNFADAILFILRNLPPYLHRPDTVDMPDRYNIAGDKQVTNEDLVKLIAKLMEKEPIYNFQDSQFSRPGHDKHYGLDSSKLASKGWQSPIPFEESLKNTIQWQYDNPEWLKI